MQSALIVLSFGLAMIVVERLAPGRRLERVAGWYPRAIVLNVVQAAAAYLSTATWDRWFPQLPLWHAGGYGLVPDALLGYVAITFIYYWWHRARHEIPFLWRWLHQIHHSASRLELLTSFYKHPVEILINGMLSSAILYVLLGLNAESAGLAFLLTGVAELFYHWNIRTPHWLGYLIQRPESHCVHHQRGRHRNNYSDLPLWDMLFGTFENPREQPRDCGFGLEAEQRLGAMLLGRSAFAQPGVECSDHKAPAKAPIRRGQLWEQRNGILRCTCAVRSYLSAAMLVGIGCLQMIGDLSDNTAVKAIGAALHASPAPKVFTAQEGFETFSSKFYIDWQDRAGGPHTLELTPHVYGGLQGPYNRRNAYGAAISYAPVLASNPRTKPMVEQVARYGFCGDARLLEELRMPRDEVVYPLHVRLEPRDDRSRSYKWGRVFTISCG